MCGVWGVRQLVTKWCDEMGVANRGIGPVVFYKGFTREFLKGSLGSSADLLRDIRTSVEEIGRGRKVREQAEGTPGRASGCCVTMNNALV